MRKCPYVTEIKPVIDTLLIVSASAGVEPGLQLTNPKFSVYSGELDSEIAVVGFRALGAFFQHARD
jgi:hypothetical protein